MAGNYDKNSNINLSGNINKVYGSSMFGNAYWEINATINSSNGKSLTVNTKRDYPSAYLASTACNNMGTSFEPTVNQLVSDILNHKDFPELIITSPINNLNYSIILYGKNRCKKIITQRVV